MSGSRIRTAHRISMVTLPFGSKLSLTTNLIAILFFHGEYGWRGIVVCAMACFVVVSLYNYLAARTLRKMNGRKHRRTRNRGFRH